MEEGGNTTPFSNYPRPSEFEQVVFSHPQEVGLKSLIIDSPSTMTNIKQWEIFNQTVIILLHMKTRRTLTVVPIDPPMGVNNIILCHFYGITHILPSLRSI